MMASVLHGMKRLGILGLLLMTFVLSGCEQTLLVRNTSIDQVVPIFKDYVGVNGFLITYENDATRSYRLSLGTYFVPQSSQLVETHHGAAQIDKEITNQTNVTTYGQTIVQTINQPAYTVEATATVRMLSQGQDVLIYIDTAGPIGTSLDDFRKFMKLTGYQVETL